VPDSFMAHLGFYVTDRTNLEGKYVAVRMISEGDPFGTNELSSVPDINTHSHQRLVVIPLNNQPELARLLDTQTVVSLTGQNNDSKQIGPISATVHAVVCTKDDSGKETCSAILAVSGEGDQGVVSKNRETLKILIGP
jgi:hypothetical protein